METYTNKDGLTLTSVFHLTLFLSTDVFNKYIIKLKSDAYLDDEECELSINELIPVSKSLENRGIYDVKLHYLFPTKEDEDIETFDEITISSKVFMTESLVKELLDAGVKLNDRRIKMEEFLKIMYANEDKDN